MKKAFLVTLLTFITLLSYGQTEGQLKFLGIPIDGTEAQFATKLRAKGFTYNSYIEGYKGQFNGKNVEVYIHTNHNLVDRVYVAFPYTSEDGIRSEFNHLLSQFKNNSKYFDFSMNEEIPEDDDISYEITVNNKRYQAGFSYIDFNRDPLEYWSGVIDYMSEFFTEEQRVYLKDCIKKAVDIPEDQRASLQEEMMTEMQRLGFGQDENAEPDPMRALSFMGAFIDGMRTQADGDVWFMIHERYGRYNIGLYYDNLHNQAHGEDL